jgi:hypothetical protein
MGNFNSQIKTSYNSKIIYKKNIITDDEIKDSQDAILLSNLKYREIGDTNTLIGYNDKVTLNDLTFIKYKNGRYLYMTGNYSVMTIFGDEYNCDIINNIRLETENINIKMYIQVKCLNEDTPKLYEAENFELKWANAPHYKDFRFAFITNELMPDSICILSTKYFAYPNSFRIHISNFYCVSPLQITDVPLQPSPKQIDLRTLYKLLFIDDVLPYYCEEEREKRFERLLNIKLD